MNNWYEYEQGTVRVQLPYRNEYLLVLVLETRRLQFACADRCESLRKLWNDIIVKIGRRVLQFACADRCESLRKLWNNIIVKVGRRVALRNFVETLTFIIFCPAHLRPVSVASSSIYRSVRVQQLSSSTTALVYYVIPVHHQQSTAAYTDYRVRQ